MYGTQQRFNRSPTEDSSLNNTLPREHSIEDSLPRPYASLDYYARMRHKNVGPRCNENPRSIYIANALKMHATSANKVVHNGPSIHYNNTNHMNNKIDNRQDLFPDESFEEIRTEEDIFLPRGSSHKQTVNNQRDESPYPDYDDDYGTDEYIGEDEDEDEAPRIDIIKGCSNGQTFLDILYGTPKAGRRYSGTESDDTEEEEKHRVKNRHSRTFTHDNNTSGEYEELRPRHNDPHVPSRFHEVPKSDYHRRAHIGRPEDKYDPPQPYPHVPHHGQPANAVPEAAKRVHRHAAEPFGTDRSNSGAVDKNSSFSAVSSTARAPYANGATIGSGLPEQNPWNRMPESPVYRSRTTQERNSTQYRVSEENQRSAKKRGESKEKGARRADENDKKEIMRESSESMHQKRQGKDSEVKRTSSDHERIDRKTRRQMKECKLPSVSALMAVKECDDDDTAPDLSSIVVVFETREHVPKWSWDRPNKPLIAKDAVAKQHEEQTKAAEKQVKAKRKEEKDAAKAFANGEKARRKYEEEEKENKEAKKKVQVGKVSNGCFGRSGEGTENEATKTSDEKINGINWVEKKKEGKDGKERALEKSRSKHATRTKEDKRPTENPGKSEEPCETNVKKRHSRSHSHSRPHSHSRSHSRSHSHSHSHSHSRPHSHSRSHSRSHSHSHSRPGHRRNGADDAGSNARRSGEEPGRQRSESSKRRRTQSRRLVERKDNVDKWSDVN